MTSFFKSVGGQLKKGYTAVKGRLPAWLVHHRYKMLLVGETGSGKTSFLNLLCNCGLVQALGFTEGSAQFRNFNDIKLENAQSRKMESKTSGAKRYNVELGDLKVGVIDTPGFGDSRGMEEDKANVKKIVDTLQDEEHVNCVCLIINGRQSRMSATLRYVLTEITAILPREVLGNVIVVFTNTADPLDLNFDPSSLPEFLGRQIEHERFFSIENPYCRFEKAKAKQGKLSREMIEQSLKKSFDETAKQLKKMCAVMRDFEPVHTHRFATLYRKKQEVEKKVIALLTAYDNQTELEKKIQQAKDAAEAALATKTLNTKYSSTQQIDRWITVDTNHHNTLCGAAGCYSNCHAPCGLSKSYDKKAFLGCASMSGEYCKKCKHHYSLHYHNEVRFEKETYTKEWVDETMKKKFEEAKSMEEREKILKDKLDSERNESETERKRLSQQLLLTIEEFEEIGVNRNYAKLLENQIAVVEHRLEGTTGKETEHLRRTKEEIEKKLVVVQETLKESSSHDADAETFVALQQSQKEPFFSDADVVAPKVWAWETTEVDPSPTKDEVDKARSNYPDKVTGSSNSSKSAELAQNYLVHSFSIFVSYYLFWFCFFICLHQIVY